MSLKFPNVGEAQEILKRHRARFEGVAGVLGVGVAMRNGKLKFIVAVTDHSVCDAFRSIKNVEHLQVQYEVSQAKAAASQARSASL